MVSDGDGEGSCKANYIKEVRWGKSKYKVVSKLKKKKKKKKISSRISVTVRILRSLVRTPRM